MSKIQNVGSSAPSAVMEQPAPASQQTQTQVQSQPEPAAPQDAKDKVGGLKLEGQMREAQVRSQFAASPTFKMPGVDFEGPSLNDPKLAEGFKAFDKPMPSVDMKWPEKGDWKETTDKDGKVHREMTGGDGTSYTETIEKDGTKERISTDKDGNRKMELSNSNGYTLRGGADKAGNSWTVDSNGVTTRMHTDAEGKLFSETMNNGIRTRQMTDRQGNQFTETLKQDGSFEREIGDLKGNRQFEAKDAGGFSMKGYADTKGNSYTVDSNGTSTRMHQEKGSDKSYSENSFKDGSRTRQILDRQGNVWTERKDIYGNVTKTHEKLGG